MYIVRSAFFAAFDDVALKQTRRYEITQHMEVRSTIVHGMVTRNCLTNLIIHILNTSQLVFFSLEIYLLSPISTVTHSY